MKQKQPMVTINWRGKKDKRGLTESAIELLEKTAIKTKRPILEENAKRLRADYDKLLRASEANKKGKNKYQFTPVTFQQELEIVSRYVKVVI